MHYLYLIESKRYDKYYIGQTSDLDDRIQRHNENRCKYTKGKGPWDIVAFIVFQNRRDAVIEEKRLKKAKNKDYIYNYFKSQAYPA